MKKNIRKIPPNILAQAKRLASNDIVAVCSIQYSAQRLRDGILGHLGIVLSDTGLSIPEPLLPPTTSGKYSLRNSEGFEIVRYDLPKETHYNPVEAPDWGEYSYGTHTVYLPYEKYPRDFQPPRELTITIFCPNCAAGQPSYILTFKIDDVLDKTSPEFVEHLLSNLNLLQENVGSYGIALSGLPLIEYTKTLNVAWELFPPGTKDEALARIFKGRTPSEAAKNVAADRYDFFDSLKPIKLIVGSSGFRRYFGAMLADDLVVFENLQYGNAVYVMYDQWEVLSQQSRIDLLRQRIGDRFDRIIHTPSWKEVVTRIVKEKQLKTKPKH